MSAYIFFEAYIYSMIGKGIALSNLIFETLISICLKITIYELPQISILKNYSVWEIGN